MTTHTDYVFAGTGKWVSTNGRKFKPDEPEKWTMAFYPESMAVRKSMQATGIKNHVKLDDETGEAYFTLRSDTPYTIIDEAGEPVTALVGNGSSVKVKLHVEVFTSPKYGTTARSKVTEVMVTKLVPYEKPVEAAVTATASPELPV